MLGAKTTPSPVRQDEGGVQVDETRGLLVQLQRRWRLFIGQMHCRSLR